MDAQAAHDYIAACEAEGEARAELLGDTRAWQAPAERDRAPAHGTRSES